MLKPQTLKMTGKEEEEEEEVVLERIVDLTFQNHYFRSLLHHNAAADLKNKDEIKELKRQLEEEKQTRVAAEQALQHLRDSSDSNLSLLLQERDAKYADLDSKFTRLHKRAKQRIQDLQKDKDDLHTLLQQRSDLASSLQQELDRARLQSTEALKSLDLERQQLRSLNNQLRDNIEELRHSLEPKEHALEALRESLLDKDQMLENMRGLLQASEEKRQASVVELTVKHQKHLESLEMQLAEAMSERNKATETISSLQVLVAEKESLIAELDAASSGEEARLKAALESVKGELVHQKLEHDKEKEKWEATCNAIKSKLETAESNCIRAEIEAAKTRSQLELQLSTQTKLLNDRDAELAACREQISRLEAEFSSYKVRAHSLLQKKDAELAAVNDSEQVKCLEEALKDVETELSSVSSERDKAVEELQHALASCEKVQQELIARVAACEVSDKLIRDLEMKLDSQKVQYQSEKDAWESKLRYLEETWRDKYEALKADTEAFHAPDLHKELEELKLKYGRLKEEHDSFRELADSMMEDKDKDISRLLNENKKIQHSLKLKLKGDGDNTQSRALQTQDNSSTSLAEQQILMLARQQAQREEELAQSQRHILALQEEIEELERENRLHNQQVSMLKEELRSMDRARKREGVDMTYLKNVVLKLLETGEVEALLPVVAMLLQFSPDEIQKCQQAYRNYTDMSPSSTNDASSRSLFSRFSFV